MFNAPGRSLLEYNHGTPPSPAEHPARLDDRAHEVQNLLRVAARRHLVKGAPHAEFMVKHKGRTRGVTVAQNAKSARHLAAFIGKQDELKRMLLGKRAMALRRIRADPHDHRVEGAELIEQVAELLALDRASGGVVARVKVHDH